MSWAVHVAHMGRGKGYTALWQRNLREKENWRNPGLDGRIIIRWIFECGMWGNGLDATGSQKGQVAGSCE